MVFKLNKRVSQLSKLNSQSKIFRLNTPKLPDLAPPIPNFNAENAWTPYEEMQRLQNEMEQFIGDSYSHLQMVEVDLQDYADRYVVTVNAPSADESCLKVKLEAQCLQITLETEQEIDQADEKNDHYQYHEHVEGELGRAITLPEPADATQMTTNYHNGVLTITIPKK